MPARRFRGLKDSAAESGSGTVRPVKRGADGRRMTARTILSGSRGDLDAGLPATPKRAAFSYDSIKSDAGEITKFSLLRR